MDVISACVFQSKKSLKSILDRCVDFHALEPLLHDAPPNILKHVVGQLSKVLPHKSESRKLFITSGGLRKASGQTTQCTDHVLCIVVCYYVEQIQEIEAKPGTILAEHIRIINKTYPAEIVR